MGWRKYFPVVSVDKAANYPGCWKLRMMPCHDDQEGHDEIFGIRLFKKMQGSGKKSTW